MAHSLINIGLTYGLAAASGCLPATAQDASAPPELRFAAESFSFDRETNLVRMGGLLITQGDVKVEADEAVATSIDFDEPSEWRFTGNVRITVHTAIMQADSAVFTFDNEELSHGELQGSPATFEDPNPEGENPISGTANKLAYDSVAQTLRMTENPRLQRGDAEITGCDLVYNFATDGFGSGSADCSEPFRFRALKQPDSETPAAPPQ